MKITWLRYAVVTLFAWGLVPELRRVFDWKTGLFQPIEIASVIPLAMLVPFVWYAIRGGWRHATPLTRTFATIWLAANVYAFFVGLLTGAAPIAVAYEFLNSCAPVAIGIWFANELLLNEGSAHTIVTTLLVLGSISSVYAVAQYIAPFPWDAMWIYSSGFLAAGLPYPFSMRAWGTMNSFGPFADYLVCAILLNLPYVNIRKPLALVGIVLCCVGLAVTFVRADAIVLVAAVVLYLIVSPRRGSVAIGIGGVALAFALTIGFAPTLFGETGASVIDRLGDRFNTIDSLDTDVSVIDRQNEIQNGIESGIANPLGLGLGVVGAATKFETGSTLSASLDSGYVSRFDALGYLGFLGYVTVTLGALVVTVRHAFACSAQREFDRASFVAAAAAAQAALIAIDFAVDGHLSFDGILFWLSVALAFGYRSSGNVRERESHDVTTLAKAYPAS